MAIKPGDSVSIHAYKHNGNLYRVWEKAIVYQNNKDVLILINEDVLVTELNGRRWKTNEPAVWFFYKNEWFNVISMFKTKGINYYCNLEKELNVLKKWSKVAKVSLIMPTCKKFETIISKKPISLDLIKKSKTMFNRHSLAVFFIKKIQAWTCILNLI
jgi:protein associated with RNAse G/E